MVFDEAEGLAGDLLAQIVGAHTNVGAVSHTEGGVGDGVSEHVVGGGNADGGHDSGGSVGTIGVGVTESGVSGVSGISGVSGMGVQKGGIGISLTLVKGVDTGAGDGHAGGVDAGGGLQAGEGIGESTVGIGVTGVTESGVSGVGVHKSGIGISLSITLADGVVDVAGGAGDGHVGGVETGGGLQAGVVGIGEGTVGIGIAVAESSVSGVGVQNRGIGVSLSGDNGYKSRSKDVRKHDATMIQL